MTDQSFIGKGKIYLDGRFIGNVSEFTYGTTEDKKDLPDYTAPGGGNYNSLSRIASVTLSLILHDYSPENLALALFGSTSAVTATTVTDESITSRATLDTLVNTANLIDTDQTVTVTSDPSGTTYVEDTDYTVSAGGIVVLSTGSIPASTALLISYTKLATDVIQALTTTAQEHVLFFDGVNEAQANAPATVRALRAKFGPGEEISAIGDDFGGIPLAGEALKDTTVTTSGLSQFLEIKQAAA